MNRECQGFLAGLDRDGLRGHSGDPAGRVLGCAGLGAKDGVVGQDDRKDARD